MISNNYVEICNDGLFNKRWSLKTNSYAKTKVRFLSEHLFENCKIEGQVRIIDLALLLRRYYDSQKIFGWNEEQLKKVIETTDTPYSCTAPTIMLYWEARKHGHHPDVILDIEADIHCWDDDLNCDSAVYLEEGLSKLVFKEVKLNPEVWWYGGVGYPDMTCLGYEGLKEFSLFEVFSCLTRNFFNQIEY